MSVTLEVAHVTQSGICVLGKQLEEAPLSDYTQKDPIGEWLADPVDAGPVEVVTRSAVIAPPRALGQWR